MISRQIINVEQDFLFYLKGQIAPFKIIIIILVNFYYMIILLHEKTANLNFDYLKYVLTRN